jgi:hypothetical protein
MRTKNTSGVKAFTLRAVALAALISPSLALAQSYSPWLPIPGSGSVGVSYVGQSGDSAYVMGDVDVPIVGITGGAATKYTRDSIGLNLSYGISDSLSVDAAFGHSRARAGAADRSSGLADSMIGLNWRVLDEYTNRSAPTITLRLAGIINGDYDGARLAAIGKDASGFQLGIIIGRQITPAFSVWAGAGIENRSNSVPNATYFDINAAYRIARGLSLSAGYTSKRFGGDLNIAGPGFTPARFQEVREQRDTARIGLSYAFAANQSLNVSLGKLVNGRNTVKDDSIVGIGYTLGF